MLNLGLKLWFNGEVEGTYQQREVIVNDSGVAEFDDVGSLYREASEEEGDGNPEAKFFYKDQFDTCVPCWLLPVDSKEE